MRYRKLDPHNELDTAELLRHRELCGWAVSTVGRKIQDVKDGKLIYFFFEDEGMVGSGAIDLDTSYFGKDMSCAEDRTFSIIGVFILAEYGYYG